MDMRFRPLRSGTFATALAVSASLTACSSGANSADVNATQTPFGSSSAAQTTAAPNPSALTSPQSGSVTSRSKLFNFVVPSGWNLTNQDKAEAYLSSPEVAHNVAATIVVTKSEVSPAPALDEVLQNAITQARQDGASTAPLPQRTVGHEKTVGFRATTEVKGVQVVRTYYVVAHERQLFTVALTSAKATSKDNEQALNTVLASWSWTKAGDAKSTATGTTPAAIPTTTSTSARPSPSSSPTAKSPSGSAKPSAASTSSKPSPTAATSASATPSSK